MEIVWLKDLARTVTKTNSIRSSLQAHPIGLVYGCGSAVNPIAD
jgi:hypothetical protein